MKSFLFLLSLATCSCSIVNIGKTPSDEIAKTVPGYSLDKEKYSTANSSKTRIEIDMSTQKAQLLNGSGEVIFESDVSTGIQGRSSPRGTFRVLERIVDKRSNKYGQYVDKETKKVVVAKAWEHKGKRPANTVYQGVAMPYWMRLTWYGVGMHVGKFQKGKRSSFGCIRVPVDAQPYFYQKTQLGTKVTIK